MNTADTIAAIATGPAAGGIGVVRLSGPEVPLIAERLLGDCPPPRRARYAEFRDGAGELLDQGIALYFAAPASFTGEHVLELQGHGSRVMLQLLLQRCVELGARLARPGEFSERAFLNGKLDLAQAEAIADLISAGSEAGARAALRSLQGEFSIQVNRLLERLTRLRVHVEAAIDFPDEDIDFLADAAIEQQWRACLAQHDQLLQQARRGARLREGLHVAIVGPPNAGKSSLLNALAGDERAIVTATAGTTRDVLREAVLIDGVEITLADTAGLRADTDDQIELEGMRRARAERDRADLILAVVDHRDKAALAELQAELPDGVTVIWIGNKIDQAGPPSGRWQPDGRSGIALSAKTGQGLDQLHRALKQFAEQRTPEAGGFSARQRHIDALQRTGQHLQIAGDHLATRMGELMAEELRLAQQALGEITGVFDADALLGEIFSSFCIGK
ncbi:tRNA uridine-5-carboxymethylaminomethyl(34) synthesis GTPase MnmE [Pseudomarimonas arenosa]|uniref:tRNA modification GTPase MnmE n=1 Tax=Pseudomarimonas arenosa TaxID=2774145 RepID=A0AAW3ZK67_9GAMM|nr:tRNA uridine-5-carboxymethylaminomethyl(34) synthesis GTPase MnmE [Pseudomarimonas arenosa]MBD8526363.1 tRNA uridine-5-carboxymethylaminomethyl(34) synthesis GTPase MnmE [Pseudomarimonas arenosa]